MQEILISVAWRYARVFLSTFLSTFGMMLLTLKFEDKWQVVLFAMLISSVSAGLCALGKAFRDGVGESDLPENVKSLVYKFTL